MMQNIHNKINIIVIKTISKFKLNNSIQINSSSTINKKITNNSIKFILIKTNPKNNINNKVIHFNPRFNYYRIMLISKMILYSNKIMAMFALMIVVLYTDIIKIFQILKFHNNKC